MPTLERGGVRLHYETHGGGSGTPLLLSHGFGATGRMWLENLDALSADRSVITWDLRGHGYSDSPADPSAYTQDACLSDMVAILDACGADRVVLGGHSLGGYLSVALYAARPERIAGLVLCNTGPGFRNDDAREAWNRRAVGLADELDRKGLHALSGKPEMTGGPHDPTGLARSARGILVQHDASIIESLPHIAVPTLVVVGEHDRQFAAAADYLARTIPRASNVVIAGAGHATNIDQPDEFNQAVSDFLESIPIRNSGAHHA